MKAVFRVSNRLRAAAPIPRDFLPIPGIEHVGLCYQQRIITDPEEFNATLARVLDPRFQSRGAVIQPYMLTASDVAGLSAKPVPAPAPVEAPPPVEEVASSPKFRTEGDDIFMGNERVGGIYETGFRCAKGHAELREEIEAWLNTQPESPQ
jgi:hypothetical protein